MGTADLLVNASAIPRAHAADSADAHAAPAISQCNDTVPQGLALLWGRGGGAGTECTQALILVGLMHPTHPSPFSLWELMSQL